METTVTRTMKQDYVSRARIDARERVMGIAKYTADWKEKDMLYARIVTSTIPHGCVESIDSSAASEVHGFIDMVTCQDDKTIWNSGEREKKRRVFTDHVRFVGDCIGAVTATSRISASKAAQLVKVSYRELKGSFNIEDSLKPESDMIWEEGNTLEAIRYGYGDVEKHFRDAPVKLERHYSTSRVHNAPLEPAVSLAWWDGGKLTVVAATQSVHGCRNGIAKDLGLPPDHVRVIGYYKGGGFGNKVSSMNYDLIAAICSRRTGKPVMVEYSREEEFINVHGRWSSEQDMKLAADNDGTIRAVSVKAKCDIGAYTRHVKQGNFIEGPENYYSTKAWSAEILPIYTNTPATGHMRAPPGPQSAFAAETLVDELAHELDMNPLDVNLKNYIVKPLHGVFTSSSFRECIVNGAREFGWEHRWHRPVKIKQKTGIVTGVGMAIGSWHSGIGYGEAIVSLDTMGRVKVNTGVVDIGTGAKTTMALIASKALGIPVEDIDILWGDTDTSPFSIGESGSRTTNYTGSAVREAANQLRSEILEIAAKKHNLPVEQLSISDGKILAKSDSRKIDSLQEIIKFDGRKEIVKSVRQEPKLNHGEERFVFAAHFVEVAVDLETGEVKITDYLASHDSGEIVNRLTAESQVQGGIVMGIGMALKEKLLISQYNGSIENPSFLLYRLPNMVDIPRIKVVFEDSKDPYGPKSLGEIPIIPVTAAIGNAIFNATGVRLRSLPFSREELLKKLSE